MRDICDGILNLAALKVTFKVSFSWNKSNKSKKKKEKKDCFKTIKRAF